MEETFNSLIFKSGVYFKCEWIIQICPPASGGQIGLQTAIDQLKAMARDMGGDAIIHYRSNRAAPGTMGAGYLVAQGRVVRWK